MNILIFTNTYVPHVGGVARSVAAFVEEYRERGHQVLVVAPEFPDVPRDEIDVVRVPAIQKFNASDFSVALPPLAGLGEKLDEFQPDIVHSQHPFLLGMTALRVARYRNLALVFTHHTLYEQYTHYVPGDSPAMKRFAINLATRYANLCDQVFAPSESIEKLLRERGVTSPISVVPTGVHLEDFSHGDGKAIRRGMGIPDDAFVVGHLGRLAPEKNLEFMAQAVADFVGNHPDAHFLLVGTGPSEGAVRTIFARAGIADRLHMAGILQKKQLADALDAMNLFAFASRSETQGMVLTEAMAAGLPVVALDASGAREVVRDGHNGRLLKDPSPAEFSAALQWLAELPPDAMQAMKRNALDTAEAFSMPHTADKALACYEEAIARMPDRFGRDEGDWENVVAWIWAEWEILKSVAGAGDAAIGGNSSSDKEG
jgi:1,2-diacylglycerol 3-alpha-glucosyltransferase